MSRTNLNSKQNHSSYQSLYLWASFLWGMISLGIIVWNRRETSFTSVIPAGSRHLVHSLDPCIHAGMTQYSNFASSLALSALTYQQTQNSFASILTLLWPLVTGLQFHKRQLGKEFRVNTYTLGQQFTPRVATLTPSGEFLITWSSNGQDESSYGAYAQRYAANGTQLGKEFRVNNYTENDQSRSWPAALENNQYVIVWHTLNQDSSNFGVATKLYAHNGTALTSEFLVNMYYRGQQGFPGVFSNNLDVLFITWQSGGQKDSSFEVYGRYYFSNGSAITDEFQISNYTRSDQSQASAAALSSNRWIIAWHSDGEDGSAFGIYANIFTNYTTPLGVGFRINQYTNADQMAPTVIHFENDFIVLFVSQMQLGGSRAGNTFAVCGRRFADNGAVLSDEFRVSLNALSPWHKVSAAVLNQDYYVVVWKAVNNASSNLDVNCRICSREGNWMSSEFQVNSFPSITKEDATGGAVAALNETSFIVTYDGSGPDDADGGIYAGIITLSELNITLSTPSPTPISTIMPTPAHMSVSEPTTSNSILKTTATNTHLEAPLSSSNSVTNNNNSAVPKGDNSNIGAYIGGTVAGVIILSGLLTAGFFVCRRKSRENKVQNNGPEKEVGTALQQRDNTILASQNYARIDEVKPLEKQYDNAPKLEI